MTLGAVSRTSWDEGPFRKTRPTLYGLNANAENAGATDVSGPIADRDENLDWLMNDDGKWLTGNYPS